jgi:hypothetical protein
LDCFDDIFVPILEGLDPLLELTYNVNKRNNFECVIAIIYTNVIRLLVETSSWIGLFFEGRVSAISPFLLSLDNFALIVDDALSCIM